MTTTDIIIAVRNWQRAQKILYANRKHLTGGGDRSDQGFIESLAYWATVEKLEYLATQKYEYEGEDEYQVYVALVEYDCARKLCQHNPTRMLLKEKRKDWLTNGQNNFASELMDKFGDKQDKLINLCDSFKWDNEKRKYIFEKHETPHTI